MSGSAAHTRAHVTGGHYVTLNAGGRPVYRGRVLREPDGSVMGPYSLAVFGSSGALAIATLLPLLLPMGYGVAACLCIVLAMLFGWGRASRAADRRKAWLLSRGLEPRVRHALGVDPAERRMAEMRIAAEAEFPYIDMEDGKIWTPAELRAYFADAERGSAEADLPETQDEAKSRQMREEVQGWLEEHTLPATAADVTAAIRSSHYHGHLPEVEVRKSLGRRPLSRVVVMVKRPAYYLEEMHGAFSRTIIIPSGLGVLPADLPRSFHGGWGHNDVFLISSRWYRAGLVDDMISHLDSLGGESPVRPGEVHPSEEEWVDDEEWVEPCGDEPVPGSDEDGYEIVYGGDEVRDAIRAGMSQPVFNEALLRFLQGGGLDKVGDDLAAGRISPRVWRDLTTEYSAAMKRYREADQ